MYMQSNSSFLKSTLMITLGEVLNESFTSNSIIHDVLVMYEQ